MLRLLTQALGVILPVSVVMGVGVAPGGAAALVGLGRCCACRGCRSPSPLRMMVVQLGLTSNLALGCWEPGCAQRMVGWMMTRPGWWTWLAFAVLFVNLGNVDLARMFVQGWAPVW